MGLSTTYTKVETDYLLQKLESELVSGLRGELAISDTAPTAQGLYILSDVGTYTNLGGIVTTAGKLNYAYFDGTTWSKVEIVFPTNTAKIVTWTASAYTSGSQVVHEGKIYEANTATVAGDVPGVSSKWVEKIGGVKLDVSNGALGFDTFISNRRKISITKDDFVNNGSVFNDGRINTGDVGYWHYTDFIKVKEGDVLEMSALSGDSAHRSIVVFNNDKVSLNMGISFPSSDNTTALLSYPITFNGYIRINNKKYYQANPKGYLETNLIEKETVTPSLYNFKNVFKFDVLNPSILTEITSTNSTFTKSVDEKGLRITVDVGTKPARYNLNAPNLLNLYAGRNYAIVTEIEHVTNYGASISATFGNIGHSFSIPEEGNSAVWAKYPIIKSTVGKTTINTIGDFMFWLYNDGNIQSGTFADFYIKKLIVIDLGTDEEKPPFDAELYGALVKSNKYFTNIAVPKFTASTPFQNLYSGLKLKSLGDSLPETRTFQPFIASMYGMRYDKTEEVTTVTDGSNTYYRSTLGGSRVIPTIVGSGSTGANGSIYIRARSLKYWKPDVLLILAGANDVRAGSAHISGGTAIQPADYGLYDTAYTGGEIDLIADKTQSVPSFGSAYRGMLQQIFTDMPNCRVILISPPRPSGGTVPNSADYLMAQGKDAVIRQIAKEFGCPFVSLFETYGPNQFTRDYLTKDGLHFGTNGGKRVAMEILKVF